MAPRLERPNGERPRATLCRIGAAAAATLLLGAPAQAQRDDAVERVMAPRREALAQRRAAQARLLSVLQSYRREPPPALLVSPRSALDAARATILARALIPELERRAGTFRDQARAAANLRLASPLAGAPRRSGQGVRYASAAVATVASPLAGRVEFAGPLRGWGGVVILSGPGGHHVVLAGLDAVVESVGRSVNVGDPVGRTGGSSELYLEVRRGGEPIDPVRLLQGRPGASSGAPG